MKVNEYQSNQKRRKQGINLNLVIDREKIEEIEEILKCKICFQIMINPYDCETCEQSFCYDCIVNLFDNNKNCPENCEEKKIKQSSNGIKNLLYNLFLKCSNQDCKEELSYNQYLIHVKECPYNYIQCPNCTRTLLRKDIEIHVNDECEFTIFKCEKCNMEFKKNDYNDHKGLCYEILGNLKFNGNLNEYKNKNKDIIDSNQFLQIMCLNLSNSFQKFESKFNEISKENKDLKKYFQEKFDGIEDKLNFSDHLKKKDFIFNNLQLSNFNVRIDPNIIEINKNFEVDTNKKPSLTSSNSVKNRDFPLKITQKERNQNHSKSDNNRDKNSSDKKTNNIFHISHTFDPEKKSLNESFDFSVNNVISLNEKVDKLYEMMNMLINNNNVNSNNTNFNTLNQEQTQNLADKSKETEKNSSIVASKVIAKPLNDKNIRIGNQFKNTKRTEVNQNSFAKQNTVKNSSKVVQNQHNRQTSINRKVIVSKERNLSQTSRDFSKNEGRITQVSNNLSNEKIKTNELISLSNKIIDKLQNLEQNLNFDELNMNLQNITICLKDSLKQALNEMLKINSENKIQAIQENNSIQLKGSNDSQNPMIKRFQETIESVILETNRNNKDQFKDIFERLFREKYNFVKCGIQSCNKINYSLMTKHCDQCEIIFCRDCGVQCKKCLKIFCESCAYCPRCEDTICKSCRQTCDSCLTFKENKDLICEGCLKICKYCRKLTCDDCLKECGHCENSYCMKCGKQCKICGKMTCQKCELQSDFSNCRICKTEICNECIEPCSNCLNSNCKSCLINCQKCSKQVCKACSVICISCKQGYDQTCSKTNFQSKCFRCVKTYCTSCTKQNTQKCKSCGQNFCKKCSVQCGKCRYNFCVEDGVKCDNCRVNFCKKCLEKCPCGNISFCEACKSSNFTISPHECLFWLNSTPDFRGFKSRSMKILPPNFEVKIYLEKLSEDFSIGLTDNPNIEENSLIIYDNIWCLKVKSGMKYSSQNSLESYLKIGGREFDSLYIILNSGNLSFRINNEEATVAYILDQKKQYYLYTENETPNSESKISIVYLKN